jgi:cell division septation protein DedD
MAADRERSTEKPERAPWVEPAPRPMGIIVFWVTMLVVVGAIASVVSIVGFEDEGAVRASDLHAGTTTTTTPFDPADDLDALLAVLDVPADERDAARAGLLSDDTGEVEAVDADGDEVAAPESAGRVDIQSYGAFRLQPDDAAAAAFADTGRLACGTLGNEAGRDWFVECVDSGAGSSLAAPGPVLVVWAFTGLRVAESDTPTTLCTATINSGAEAAIVVDEPNVVRTLEVQVRGGVDPRSVRALRVGELWAFVLPTTDAAPAWRVTGTQVTIGSIATDETDHDGPPPAPERSSTCNAAALAPEDLVVPPTTVAPTTSTPATATTDPSPTTTGPATTAPPTSTPPTSAPPTSAA